MDTVKDYVELVKAPWGRMFYDLLFSQLNIPHTPKLKILDFGSGLGVTADYFAEWHEVTAVEPDEEMINNACNQNKYEQIHGSIEKLTVFADRSVDLIFCHNVLEYIENKEPIVAELLRILKPGGVYDPFGKTTTETLCSLSGRNNLQCVHLRQIPQARYSHPHNKIAHRRSKEP